MATSLLPGQVKELKSADSLWLDSQQAKYPTELLNTLNISGLPPHKLNVKIGLPLFYFVTLMHTKVFAMGLGS